MKNSINLSIFSASVPGVRKKILTMLSLLIATIFTISCRKEVSEKLNGAIMKDTTATGLASLAAASGSGAYYISPSGNDSNTGTIGSPFKTLDKLSTVMVAGDICYVRGGVYRISKAASVDNRIYIQNLNGTSANHIVIQNYPGESPIFNLDDVACTGYPIGINVENCTYIDIIGLRVTGLLGTSVQGLAAGWVMSNCQHFKVEHCELDHSDSYGFVTANASSDGLYLNCDAHHLQDPPSYGGSNGFQCTGGDLSTNITFRGCRAWWISDDGFDFFNTNGVFTMENCWAFWNGYVPGTFNTAGDGDGFKLGPTNTNQTTNLLKTLTNCIAFENRVFGFDQNGDNVAGHNSKITMYNCNAFNNGSKGFFFGYNTSIQQIFKNNISNTGINGSEIKSGPNVSNNTWNGGVTLTNADFLSVSSAGADGARQSDGSLPNINFLKLVTGSDLIDAGVNVGLPYTGSAPDRGAFESGSAAPTPTNQPPVANAGADKTIVLPVSSVSITGSGTDPDGTIASYAWSFRSGPNTPALSGTTSTALSASNLVAGTYVFRLTVTDNGGLTAMDEVSVVVTPTAPPPSTYKPINVSQSVSDAGFAYYVTQDFGTLADNSANPFRSVLRIFENGVELSPAHSSHSDIENIGRGRFSHWADGSFVALYFTASDNSNPKTNGRTYTYSIGTVSSNQSPVANAGADKTIALPVSSVSITGSGTDPDGTIASYAWSFRSGPNTPALSGTTSTALSASNLVAGTYVFRLTVTDNGGLTAMDEVSVVVTPTAPPPSTYKPINVSQSVSDAGFAYYVTQDFGTLADNSANPFRSVLRIFENGVELSPAHSSHSDIENIGRGRFSHWEDGSFVALYFSASDNSNPKTNGRIYTYSITP